MEDNSLDYQQEFASFLADYREKEMDPEEMGAFMARLAQIFASINMKLVEAEREMAVVAQDIENRTDESGKKISSAKAQVFVQATEEAFKFNTLKAHRENVEQFISSVRALQKGAMREFSYMGNT